ncbi:MAG TPA: TonB-dependent siderophore receptor [Rhodocyclaceae bacterium]|nr:TonB-dependent siderophore receptor [Rhodocyclaceae bacterium]
MLPAIAQAQSEIQGSTTLPEVVVSSTGIGEQKPSEQTGAYTVRSSSGATGMHMSLKETPQSVSVVTSQQMSDFALTSVNDVLDFTTGVVVERVETDRTYYTARGFDITNFQTDGIGMPFVYGNVTGDIDTGIYDRVEVLRGANGLMSGTGNPSATINYIRKRPTADFQASASVSYGSWNNARVVGDISGPLNEAKTLRGRFIAIGQDKDSYLDRYSHRKSMYSGILEMDLTDTGTLTVGHMQQYSQAKSPMWGALPLFHTDGSAAEWDVSTSTAADWARLNTKNRESFAEWHQYLANDWELKAIYTQAKSETHSKLFYVYGDPDPSTGLGLYAYPSQYDLDNTRKQADLRVSGPFRLAGRQHELIAGLNWSQSKLSDVSGYGVGIGTALPPLGTWDDGSFPFAEPAFNASFDGSNFTDKRKSVYLGTRLSVSDALKLIVGANTTNLSTQGTSYGVSHARDVTRTTPYLGAVYDVSKAVSVYGSYTEIFNPQFELGADLKPLKPVKGVNYEAGVKTALFDNKLNGSLAVFKTVQNNLADNPTFDAVSGQNLYTAVNAESTGFEIDVGGAITSRWNASVGYTSLAIDGDQGQAVRTYTPRQLFRLSTTYRVPMLTGLTVGGSLNWRSATTQSTTTSTSVPVTIRQGAYAILNLMARYDIDKKTSVSLNLNNVTDEKYLTSLYWTQSYYGAPRNVMLTLNWKY